MKRMVFFGFGDINDAGVSLLDITVAFELFIANLSFHKREEHLVTYRSVVSNAHTDYLLLRKCD